MIGGVRNFKAAMESENSAKGSHAPDKLYFDEAMGDGPEAGKDYLLSLMFSHFDRNNNGALEYDELHRVLRILSYFLGTFSRINVAKYSVKVSCVCPI